MPFNKVDSEQSLGVTVSKNFIALFGGCIRLNIQMKSEVKITV